MRPWALAIVLLTTVLLSGCSGLFGGKKVSCEELIANADGTNANHSKAHFDTSKGAFAVELFDDKAPKTVANFKAYATEMFFDNTLFHRVLEDFMIQGGGMDTNGQMKDPTHEPIPNEAISSECKNRPYTLSMARTSDPDSATNQFFINTAENDFLDPRGTSAGYAVFGIVVEGRTTVDTIEKTPVQDYAPGRHCQGGDDKPSCPIEDVVIRTVRVPWIRV